MNWKYFSIKLICSGVKIISLAPLALLSPSDQRSDTNRLQPVKWPEMRTISNATIEMYPKTDQFVFICALQTRFGFDTCDVYHLCMCAERATKRKPRKRASATDQLKVALAVSLQPHRTFFRPHVVAARLASFAATTRRAIRMHFGALEPSEFNLWFGYWLLRRAFNVRFSNSLFNPEKRRRRT